MRPSIIQKEEKKKKERKLNVKRRILSIVLALSMLLAIFTLAACNKDNAGEISDFNFDTTKEVKIVFYHTMGEALRAVLDKHIVEFNKLYPNIKIEHSQVGGYDDVREQIKTEITVGDQPNLAYCYPDHVALYNVAMAVQPLDGLIGATATVTRQDGTTEQVGLTEAQVNNFIDGFYNEGKQFGDGKMYTLPFSKSTEVFYYNKTVFDQNGLKVPTHWWCGDACPAGCDTSLEYVCARLKAIDPNCIPLGYDSESNWFITMCEQLGTPYTSATGEHFLFDNESNHAFVKKFREWYLAGYVTTQELSGGYTSALFTKTDAGRCYMCIGSSAGANHQIPKDKDTGELLFEVGISPIPQANAAAPKVISQGPSVCIFKKKDNQEVLASWLFLKYLTTTVEFQAEFGLTSGYLPVLETVGTNEAYAAMLAQADGGFNLPQLATKVCLQQEKAYYTSPAFNGSSTARDEVGKLMQVCLAIKANANVDQEIKNAFKAAVDECKYQAG